MGLRARLVAGFIVSTIPGITLAQDVSIRASSWTANRTGAQSTATNAVTIFARHRNALDSDLMFDGELEADGQTSATSGRQTMFDLREGFLSYYGQLYELRIGRQITTWGRSDRLKPTDVASSRDYSNLAVDDDDQKRGSATARFTVPFDELSIGVFWFPEFRANIVDPLVSTTGLQMRRSLPDGATGDHAIRIDRVGGGADWSLTYFRGHDRMPSLRPVGFPGSALLLEERYPEIQMWGVDAATSIGDYGLRFEASHVNFTKAADCLALICGGRWSEVVGFDRQFPDDFYLNTQAFLVLGGHSAVADSGSLVVFGFRNSVLANRLYKSEIGLSWSAAKQWNSQTIRVEVSGIQVFGSQGGLVQARLSYKIDDDWRVTIGNDLYHGASLSLFGSRRGDGATFLELRYGY